MAKVICLVAALAIASGGFVGAAGLAPATCAGDECSHVEEESLLQMRQVKTVVGVDSAQEAASLCPQVGARAWLSTKAFDYVSQKVFPFALSDLASTLPMAPVTGSSMGVTYSINDMQLQSIAAQKVSVQLSPGKGIQFSVSGVTASISMKYNFASWFFNDAGSATATLGSATSLSFFLAFSVDATGNPMTRVQNLSTIVKIASLTFNGKGGSTLNSLTSVLMPVLESTAQSTMVQLINTTLNADINTLIKSFDFGIPMNGTSPRPWNASMKVCSVAITANYIALDVYAAVQGVDVYPKNPATLSATPTSSMTSPMFGCAATPWMVTGLAWFAQVSNLMQVSLTGLQAPAPVGKLSFSGYTTMMVSAVSPPTISFTAGGFSALANARIGLEKHNLSNTSVSAVMGLDVEAKYKNGTGAFELKAAGNPSALIIGKAAPPSFRSVNISYWASLFVKTANANVANLINQAMAMNSTGSQGVQIKNQQLSFTPADVTAFADIQVDIKKLLQTILGAGNAPSVSGR